MKRRERTRILIQGSSELRARLAREVLEHQAVVAVAEPSAGLVMTQMRETAKQSRFYLGEVLVTEAKVRIGESLGLGIIAGDDTEAAYDLAVIDAAFNAGVAPEDRWLSELEEESRRIESRHAREDARILETRVDFQTMDTP